MNEQTAGLHLRLWAIDQVSTSMPASRKRFA
jgi:hypothetical protein